MTVALAGRSGLIGAAVWSRLSQSRAIRTIGRNEASDLAADLSDPASVQTLDLDGCDALVNCAGVVDEDFVDRERAFRHATLAMSALVQKAKHSRVRVFIYISSAHVYGTLTGTLSERSSPNPLSDYAIAHFASEQILRRAADSLFRVIILRPCAVFGMPLDLHRFRRWNLVPFAFPRAAIIDRAINLSSRGLQRRNFVGTDDIAVSVETCLDDRLGEKFRIVNPVGRETMSILAFGELCSRVAEMVTGRPCKVTRPDGIDAIDDGFEYVSCDRRFIGNTELQSSIEQLSCRIFDDFKNEDRVCRS